METKRNQNSQVTQPLVGAHSCGAAGTLARVARKKAEREEDHDPDN